MTRPPIQGEWSGYQANPEGLARPEAEFPIYK